MLPSVTNVDYAGGSRGKCLMANCRCPEFVWLGNHDDILCAECRCRAAFHTLLNPSPPFPSQNYSQTHPAMALANKQTVQQPHLQQFPPSCYEPHLGRNAAYSLAPSISQQQLLADARSSVNHPPYHQQTMPFPQQSMDRLSEKSSLLHQSSPPCSKVSFESDKSSYEIKFSEPALSFMKGDNGATSKFHMVVAKKEVAILLNKYVPKEVTNIAERANGYFMFFEALMAKFPDSHAWYLLIDGLEERSLRIDHNSEPSTILFKSRCISELKSLQQTSTTKSKKLPPGHNKAKQYDDSEIEF